MNLVDRGGCDCLDCVGRDMLAHYGLLVESLALFDGEHLLTTLKNGDSAALDAIEEVVVFSRLQYVLAILDDDLFAPGSKNIRGVALL